MALIEAAERDGRLRARRHDRRADLRQHRHRARDRRAAQGLPRDRRDARQDVPGEDRPAARLRRRGRARADRRPAGLAAVLLPGRRPADGRDPGRVPAQPVLQPGQPGGPLRVDRARALGADRRPDHPPGRRRRHRRHDHRHRPLPARAQARPRGGRRRPRGVDLLGRTRERPPLPRRGRRRGLLAADVRPVAGRPLGHGVRPRRVPDHAPARPARGHPRRRLGRPRAARRARGRRRGRRTPTR